MMDSAVLATELPEFFLLTGALGSGKTTLLSDFLALGTAADTGVIINDAGELNVDGAVIQADHRDLAMAVLSDGCICCSMGNNLQEGIDALLRARAEKGLGPPCRIILETSGLAEPAPILRSVRQLRQQDFRLRILSTFDAASSAYNNDFVPSYAAQLAASHAIFLTKLDDLSPEESGKAGRRARSFNPLATVVAIDDRTLRARKAFDGTMSLVDTAFRLSSLGCERAQSRIQIGLARWRPQATWPEIGEWIENAAGHLGDRLLRMKGFVKPSGARSALFINGVGGVFPPPRPVPIEDDGMLGLVMIMRDTSAHDLSRIAGEEKPIVSLR
ncbi:GTP-binding protein [Rhizobium sp. AU243]|uniref:CobW family GTP-binding protein n=1 Tax=Rhizobium sp. AU243 TaxID=2303425 RepID=UPI0010CC5DCB|nr:GTP-binding protein [Rhizobium sp. AU243]TKV70784.1 hypothetical protein D0C28_25540 [Rhizobium sp. AU243]